MLFSFYLPKCLFVIIVIDAFTVWWDL